MQNGEDKTDKTGLEHIMKYLGVFGGAQIVSMFLNLLRSKAASKLLGTHGVGVIALYNRTIQMFADSTNLSLSFSAVRRLSVAYEEEDDRTMEYCVKVVRSIALFTGIIGMVLLFASAPMLGDTFDGSPYYISRFMLLSPVPVFMAVAGGELAILRGVRRLEEVASYSFLSALISLLLALPFYYYMGLGGAFPTIFLTAFFQMALLLFYSTRKFRYHVAPFSLKVLRDGIDIIKLGAGYIFSTIMVSFAIWYVCKTISEIGDGGQTGLFSAGYMMIGLLPGVLFAAMDSDYYPRLSALSGRVEQRNAMVNEHIEVHLLVQSPFIIAFMVMLPFLIPLFHSAEFTPATLMTQLAMVGVFVNTMTYPISFLPLSKSDTKVFVLQEGIYNLMFIFFIIWGYMWKGLVGIGVAYALVKILDFFVIYVIARIKYDFRLSRRVSVAFVLQAPLCAAAVVLALLMPHLAAYYCIGLMCAFVSAAISLYMISKRMSLMGLLLKRFRRKK